MTSLPDPTFIGFKPKKVARTVGWLKNPTVKDICSVSDCISQPPPDWINSWTHNDLGLYDTVEAARNVIPPGQEAEYEVFAYQLYPVAFGSLGMTPNDCLLSKNTAPASVLDGWMFLGYDLASRSTGSYFECSPLSCNHCAENCPVNRYCLLDDLGLAIQKGIEFGDQQKSGVEPGPYYLLKVFRKKQG